MSNVQQDVLTAIVSGQSAKMSGKEIAGFVCGARSLRGEESTVVMVKRAIEELVSQRILEKYAYADIFNLTEIGMILVGKLPVTAAARDHLSRHGYREIPFALSEIPAKKVAHGKVDGAEKRHSEEIVVPNQRRDHLQTNIASNVSTASVVDAKSKTAPAQKNRFDGVSMPPYADALHFTHLERVVAGMLYDNLRKGGASLSVRTLTVSLDEKENTVTRTLSALSKRGFISFAPHSSSEKSLAYMQAAQAADLGWGGAVKGDTPYLSFYGFSMTSQIILRYMCLRREKEKKSNTSLMQAQRLLEDAGVITGSQKECELLTKNAMDILEQQGLISYIHSNMVYYVTLPAFVLLGVKAPSASVVQKILSHEALRKLWAILQAHPGFDSLKKVPTADLFPGAPETVTAVSSVSTVAQECVVAEQAVDGANETLSTQVSAIEQVNSAEDDLMSEQSAGQDVSTPYVVALEKLQLLAKTATVKQKIFEVDVKVQILGVIARAFAYDQADVMRLLESVSADLKQAALPAADDGDVLSSRVLWAARCEPVVDAEEKIALLTRLSKAFSTDQTEIATALRDIANDVQSLTS